MITTPTSHCIVIGLQESIVSEYFRKIETYIQAHSSIESYRVRNIGKPHITLYYLPEYLEKYYTKQLQRVILQVSEGDIRAHMTDVDFFLSRDQTHAYIYIRGELSTDIINLRDGIIGIKSFPEVYENTLEYIPHITLLEVFFRKGFSDFEQLKSDLNDYVGELHTGNIAESIEIYEVDSGHTPEILEAIFSQSIRR